MFLVVCLQFALCFDGIHLNIFSGALQDDIQKSSLNSQKPNISQQKFLGSIRLRVFTSKVSGNLCFVIGAAGFEPTTPTTPKWCATKLRYAPDTSTQNITRFVIKTTI